MPLFGIERKLHIVIDPELLQHDGVWPMAGTWIDNFLLALGGLLRVSGAVIDLKRS